MTILRNEYAKRAINQIPRLLSMQDRNPYSKTYGCFDRMYWLDKAIDFPSAIMQFAVQSLALVYSEKFPNNPYYKNDNILKWAIAGMEFWTKIQKKDGSFDEFYPNEHGWAGPTGFLLYAMIDSYERLKSNIEHSLEEKILETAKKSALYLAKYDEAGILANHHAIALLAIYYASKSLEDETLLYNFEEKFNYFLGLQSEEGWFLEYDGADPGYLSATVSFLAKLYKLVDDKEFKEKIFTAVEKAIKFSSYFVYPNGFYAGTIGSRQTLHFYPSGYEFFGNKIPLAHTIANKMLESLHDGKLVPPEIMPGRYLPYRTSEFLLSYLDYTPRKKSLPKLPFEGENFEKYFPKARILVKKNERYYAICNLAKGGVIKAFDLKNNRLVLNDCGVIGKLKSEKVVCSQWIGPEYEVIIRNGKYCVKGPLYSVSTMAPTPFKNLLLRGLLLSLGWNTTMAYKIKELIRNILILKNKKSKAEFERCFEFLGDEIAIHNSIAPNGETFKSLSIGGEFAVRYVPQSLYFQSQELDIKQLHLNSKTIEKLNEGKSIKVTVKVGFYE